MIAKTLAGMELSVTELLQKDHLEVEALFRRIRAAQDPQQKFETFEQIRSALLSHSLKEESVFYPACEKLASLKKEIQESYHEHSQITHLLEELSGLPVQSEQFEVKLGSLMRHVQHHVREEENLLFPKVRHFLSPHRLHRLSEQIEKAAGASDLPKAARPKKHAA